MACSNMQTIMGIFGSHFIYRDNLTGAHLFGIIMHLSGVIMISFGKGMKANPEIFFIIILYSTLFGIKVLYSKKMFKHMTSD